MVVARWGAPGMKTGPSRRPVDGRLSLSARVLSDGRIQARHDHLVSVIDRPKRCSHNRAARHLIVEPAGVLEIGTMNPLTTTTVPTMRRTLLIRLVTLYRTSVTLCATGFNLGEPSSCVFRLHPPTDCSLPRARRLTCDPEVVPREW